MEPTTQSAGTAQIVPNRKQRRAAAHRRPARTKHGSHRAWAPMMVVAHLVNSYTIHEFNAAQAFRLGYAQAEHFATLVECHNMLVQAAKHLHSHVSEAEQKVCAEASAALVAIRTRGGQDKGWTATEAEQEGIDRLVAVSQDFWPRQTQKLFAECYYRLRDTEKRGEGK